MKDMKCMKKKRKNILRILVLALVVVGALVYWTGSSKVGDAGWGKGEIKTSEQFYYESRFRDIIKRWRDRAWSTKENVAGYFLVPYNEYLHVDLNKGAIWIEIDGKVHPDDYLELPANMKWKLSIATQEAVKDLGQQVKLKIRGVRTNRILPEVIHLVGTGRGSRYFGFRIGSAFGDVTLQDGSGPIIKPSGGIEVPGGIKLYGSLIVSDDEYAEYTELFGGKTEDVRFEGSDEAISWLSVRKKVFQQIDVEVSKHGYELDEIEYLKAGDDSAVLARVECWRKSSKLGLIYSIFVSNRGKSQFLVKVDYLGEGVWYSRSYPDLQTNCRENHLKMEFLTHNQSSMSKKEFREWMAKGKPEHEVAVDPDSKWKVELEDGTVIELLQVVQGSCFAGDWWGPDGSSIDSQVLLYDKNNTNSKDRFTLIFKFVWAPNTMKSKINLGFGASSNGGGHTRSGLHPEHTIKSFSHLIGKPGENIPFSLTVSTNGGKAETVTFKNISLEPGVDHGFEILKVE